MGNRDRGVVLVTGGRRVVNACGFARLVVRGLVDWKVTPRLKGDRWAIYRGCGRGYAP